MKSMRDAMRRRYSRRGWRAEQRTVLRAKSVARDFVQERGLEPFSLWCSARACRIAPYVEENEGLCCYAGVRTALAFLRVDLRADVRKTVSENAYVVAEALEEDLGVAAILGEPLAKFASQLAHLAAKRQRESVDSVAQAFYCRCGLDVHQ